MGFVVIDDIVYFYYDFKEHNTYMYYNYCNIILYYYIYIKYFLRINIKN